MNMRRMYSEYTFENCRCKAANRIQIQIYFVRMEYGIWLKSSVSETNRIFDDSWGMLEIWITGDIKCWHGVMIWVQVVNVDCWSPVAMMRPCHTALTIRHPQHNPPSTSSDHCIGAGAMSVGMCPAQSEDQCCHDIVTSWELLITQ